VGTSSGIAAPWMNTDVGFVGLAGCASFQNGAFALTGSGTDIWEMADGFHFVHKEANGDIEIKARVNSIQGTNAWAKAGLMIREDLSASSRHVLVAVTSQNGIAIQWRNSTGGISENVNITGYAAPYWIRLTRVGDVFTAYRSPDNVNWFVVGSTSIGLVSQTNVGMVVTAHDNAQLNTASFDNVSTIP
jgi:regulation of enolase protein 1 (concanavalin A-like superfamily)